MVDNSGNGNGNGSTTFRTNNQGRSIERYSLHRFEDIEAQWLTPSSSSQLLTTGRLCWVLQSKGKRRQGGDSKNTNNSSSHHSTNEAAMTDGGQRKELLNRARILEVGSNRTTLEHDISATHSPRKKKHKPDQQNKNSTSNDEDDRILVQYPQGSTYRVKRDNLLPILTWSLVSHQPLVMVLPETRIYHRWTVVHTQATDQFCEIGCDVGILVHRVWKYAAPSVRHRIWGLDKGVGGIASAQKRYPQLAKQFRVWNVPLLKENDTETKTDNVNDATPSGSDSTERQAPLPMDLFTKDDNETSKSDNDDATEDIRKSLVVAIDINGNRELEAVRQCVQLVIQEWKPRLIVVKSRALYADLGHETTAKSTIAANATVNAGTEVAQLQIESP